MLPFFQLQQKKMTLQIFPTYKDLTGLAFQTAIKVDNVGSDSESWNQANLIHPALVLFFSLHMLLI